MKRGGRIDHFVFVKALPGDVAVVIVNWNSGALLSRCLDAVAAQTLRPRRTIVVDNASGDESIAAAEGRTGVEIVRSGHNAGFAAANNLAARQAEGCPWLALLN